MDNLESRIRALEASNRRQRYSITALAAIIIGGTFIAATRPGGDATFDTVTCKQWALVDKNEKLRIVAITSADGDAGMTWFDKAGKLRIAVSTKADGSADMTWLDKDGKTRIRAATLADGTVKLPTTDRKP